MTEYAISPIMLTPTPSTNNVIRRRSSIRRGTIASISKDVRVNDVVEIIKKQKALQQQERTTIETESSLRRRHSMMNLIRPTIVLKSKQQVSNNLKQQQQQMNTSTAKIRLVEEEEGVFQHLRKCVACISHDECSSSSSEEDNSPSPSTSSSSNMMRPFIKQQSDDSGALLLHDVEQRGKIIDNLNSSITSYLTEIKDFINNSAYYTEQEYKNKMNKCKALVAQQQSLLNRLETVCNEPSSAPATIYSAPPPSTKHPTSSIVPNSNIKSLCNEIYKGFKSSTTGFTIKQKKDKNEADTIISVQGVCTTVESNLIPDKLLVTTTSDDITTFNQSSVYQHKYSLNITHQDRTTKFKLMDQDQWQKDDKVNSCSYKQCHQVFNWFQRKHHCRGCGQIYCNTHSGNRLPLFSAKETNQPVFSRVCDKCFYNLASHSLST